MQRQKEGMHLRWANCSAWEQMWYTATQKAANWWLFKFISSTAVPQVADVSHYTTISCCRQRTWFLFHCDRNPDANLDFSQHSSLGKLEENATLSLYCTLHFHSHSCLFPAWFPAHSLWHSHQSAPASPFTSGHSHLSITILWLEGLFPSNTFTHWKS